MALQDLITAALILVGAGVMLLAILGTARVLAVIGQSRYRRLWRVLMGFQIGFVLGYLAACALVVARYTALLLPLVGAVFCLGALFVYLVVRLGYATIHDLQRARQEAEQASRAKSAFLANMSHELRTPLNAIIGYSDLLLEDATELEQATSDLERIRGAGQHLLGLISDILDIAKIEAGRIDIHPSLVELAPLVGSVVAAVEPLARRNRNQIALQVAPEPATIYADEVRLRQILINLVGNACKFTEDGEVTLTVKVYNPSGASAPPVAGAVFDRRSSVVFAVRDTGIGMNREELRRIFEPFVQVDPHATRRQGGSGLGLAIAHELARMMGGEITATSVPGRGSTFTLVLPTAPESAHVRGSLTAETQSAQRSARETPVISS